MYTRVAEIRSGKETVLWRGLHPDSTRPEKTRRVTVKEPVAGLPPGDLARVISQMERESRFLEQLDHERIVRPVQWDPPSRLLMEDTQGSLLQLLAREGTLGVDLVARVMMDCLGGLTYLHERKLAHGSLCASSVLIGTNCDVKLGDFIGCRVDQGHAPIPPEYLQKYKAPELLTGAPSIDSAETRAARIDLYALGFLACELLTGREFDRLFWPSGVPPAEGDANWLWWHGDPTKTLPPLKQILTDVPEALLGIISNLIEKNPARRPTSAREVQAELEDLRLVSNRKLPPLDVKPQRKEVVPDDEDEPAGKVIRRVVKKLTLELWAGDDPPVHTVRFNPRKHSLVGRGEGCRFQIKSPAVSEKHALFLCQATGDWWVYDLNSRTKFRVNEVETPAAELLDGATFEIGGQSFTVRLVETPPPDVRDFELVRKLHDGQSGELHLARWRMDGRPVVIRLLPPAFAFNAEDIARFDRGMNEAGRIRHPNLVALYRAGFVSRGNQRIWYLASEFLPGGSLRDRLNKAKRPLAVDEVIRFGIDVCEAFNAVADRGLVHRNVNPACILFAKDRMAKLGDFILLRDEVVETIHQITRGNVPTGESVYQSPEVLGGERVLTAACDVYSLAACAYQALTLHPPFNADQPILALLDQIQRQSVVPPRRLNSNIPPELEELLLWAMEKDPRRRPKSPDEFQRALKELLVSAPDEFPIPLPRPRG